MVCRTDSEERMAGEFSRRTQGLLDRAETVCEHRGAKLTELRRHVLALVLDSASPIGAYDLLDRLRQARRGGAPPTVYRALDFLLEQGLIHKVERLSAFVGCVAGCTTDDADHEEGEGHTHAAQFLICRRIDWSHASPPRSSLWSNQTSIPAARRASQIFWAACASCEA